MSQTLYRKQGKLFGGSPMDIVACASGGPDPIDILMDTASGYIKQMTGTK